MLNAKESYSHKVAAKYILSNSINESQLSIFENDYVNNSYIDLLKVSKKLYNELNSNASLKNLSETLDKKRDLTKKFKFLTGIEWRL